MARLVAIHPGSGGERKNWPPERWVALARWLLALELPGGQPRLLLVGGEADAKALAAFHGEWPGTVPGPGGCLFAENLPLPCVGALLARCRLFVGHDSGISHLAAAVGRRGRAAVRPDRPGHLGAAPSGDARRALRQRRDGRHHPRAGAQAAVLARLQRG